MHADRGVVGRRSTSLQSPNYRIVATRRADRLAWSQPPGYDPLDYELVRRLSETRMDPLTSMNDVPSAGRQLVALNGGGLGSLDLSQFGGRRWITTPAGRRAALARRSCRSHSPSRSART